MNTKKMGKTNLILLIVYILGFMTFSHAEKIKKEIKEKKMEPKRVLEKFDENKLKYIQLSRNLKTIMEDQNSSGKILVIKFNNTDIKKIIKHFSKVLDYKIMAEPGIKGNISFESKNMPWHIVLAKFLFENELEMVFVGDQAIIRKKPASLLYTYLIIFFLIFLIFFFLFFLYKKKERKSADKSGRNIENLNPIFLDESIKKIVYLFEIEKIYTDENLSIQTLSEKLSIQPYILSKIINIKMGISFPTLLNNYRIDEAKRKLGNTDLNILDISLSVGFNTKTSFNRTFKKITGLTPSQFKQNKQTKNR